MAQELESLKTHLAIVKKAPADKIQQDFYQFMNKAKDSLGETCYHMAQFYFEYGHFILQKQEANMDIFNEQAVPKNVHEEQDEQLENIPEDYEEDSSYLQGIPAQNNQQIEGKEQQIKPQGDQPEIIEGDEIKQGEAPSPEVVQNEDDKDICVINLEMAVQLYNQQLCKIKSGNSFTSIDQVYNGLRRARTRLGDLYLNDENFTKSVEYYRKVIELQSEREGFESNRLVSEIFYLIGNAYLYENLPECQPKAISQYLKATNTLLNHLNLELGYDISEFDIPTAQKIKVDRVHYMAMPGDSAQVIEVKEIISCLLDKIQDAHGQIGVREAYEKQKKKIEQEKNANQFKPVEPTAKVINLGSFGNRNNRKKMPEQEELPGLPFKLNGEINNSSLSQLEKQKDSEKKPEA